MSGGYTSLPHVKALFNASIDQVLELWQNTSDEDLKLIDTSFGATLLFYAVQRPNHEEAVTLARYLVDERNLCEPAHVDVNNQTALYFAARDGNKEACEYLVQAGCDPCSRDTAGQTALFYASREGHCDVIRALEEAAVASSGPTVNVTDKAGQSALFYAAREGRQDACELLLELGADPSIRDYQKKSAHTYATRRGHTAVGALLKAKSAEARKSAQAFDDDRQKVLLQYNLQVVANQFEWIFPTPDIIEEFEKEFPNLAAWSHMHTPIYQPSDGLRMEWCQICLDIVNIIGNYKDAIWFMKPVDTKALNCPDYYDIVKEPRDLSMIRKKLRELEYSSIQDFKRDISLVWENCFRYNPAASQVYKAGEHIKQLFEKAWNEKHLEDIIARELALEQALTEGVVLR